jgi:hypothetical protein
LKGDVMNTLKLSDAEWQVVEELLRHEQSDLPSEIHHTDSPTLGDELQKRQALVAGILERMSKAKPATKTQARVAVQ